MHIQSYNPERKHSKQAKQYYFAVTSADTRGVCFTRVVHTRACLRGLCCTCTCCTGMPAQHCSTAAEWHTALALHRSIGKVWIHCQGQHSSGLGRGVTTLQHGMMRLLWRIMHRLPMGMLLQMVQGVPQDCLKHQQHKTVVCMKSELMFNTGLVVQTNTALHRCGFTALNSLPGALIL